MFLEIKDVRITVVKKLQVGELFKKFAVDEVVEPCDQVKVGQEWISKGINKPDGFCSWAWADIQRDVAHLALGGDFPWIKQKGTILSACTDGLRPVVFKLQRI